MSKILPKKDRSDQLSEVNPLIGKNLVVTFLLQKKYSKIIANKNPGEE